MNRMMGLWASAGFSEGGAIMGVNVSIDRRWLSRWMCRAQLKKQSQAGWELYVIDKDAQWRELLKALATISRALPPRRPQSVPAAVAEADYLEAGKLYALHKQAIYDAINAIRVS